jgi:arginine repressor
MVSVISLGKVYTMGTVDLTLFAPQLLTGSADTKYNRLSISDKLTLTLLRGRHMSSVAEFIEIRKSIETLASQITLCVEQKAVQESKRNLDEANRQLEVLKPMVDNDVQVIVAGRLSRQLRGLGTKVEKMVAKLPARKRLAGKLPAGKKRNMSMKMRHFSQTFSVSLHHTGDGLLIQTSAGRGSGFGILPLNRSGCRS